MKYLLTIFLLLTGSAFCPAQTSLPAELHFNHLSVKDGLPEGFVESMIQDRQGYIWMTTQMGLVRYDGYQPKIYTMDFKDLSNMSVSTIYQDRNGRIWAGTYPVGLYLYDPGKDRFIHYPLDSTISGSLSHFEISAIKDDGRGRLWLTVLSQTGQKYSIILFDPGTRKFTRFGKQEIGKNYIDADNLYNVCQDSKGHIWMSSSNGLYESDDKNERFTAHLATADSTMKNGFCNITEDASQPGVLWFTNANFNSFYSSIGFITNKGLWRFNMRNDSATVFYHNPQNPAGIANDTIFKVFNDSRGRLWVGTMSGLSLFDRAKDDFINYYPTERKFGYDNSVIDILEDKSGNFWCQTGKGILYFDTQTRKFTRFTANPKQTDGLLSNDENHTFLMEQSGTLWFGVDGDGVQWVNRQRSGFIQYSDNPGALHYFPGGAVNGFAKSADGSICIGAQHGLYRWQPQTDSFTAIKFWKGSTVNEYASAPMIDHNGKVWFFGYNNGDYGLDCYDPRTGKAQYYRYKKNDSTSLSSNHIDRIYEDHLGYIWVGTSDSGICRLDQQTQKFIRYPYSRNDGSIMENHGALDDVTVLSIFEDKSGTLWVGTNHGGLNRFNRETSTFTSYNNALPGFTCVISIYEDNQNKLWAGTYMSGFFQFNVKTGKPEMFTEKNGLLYDGVDAILEDSSHNLWLTSARGISIFNPQTRQVRTLTTANGLPAVGLYSATKISNSEFLIGGDNGFIVVDPEDFMPDANLPVVHIKSVGFNVPGSNPTRDSTIFAFGKKDISLSYKENRLTFDYVGLYYQQADLVKYAYKLEGYDKDWITAGTQRTVTYTNLSPGTYTFRVKAANSGGVWSTEDPSLAITIYPPWWKTWGAYILYILLACLGIYTFIRRRTKTLQKEKVLLEEKVTARTSELKESLNNLKSTQARLIQSEKMASLGELTAGIAHEIQNPLNFVNNFSDVNKELLVEMKEEIEKGNIGDAKEIANDVIDNEEKINHHGKRAGDIVKGMLQHSRTNTGVKEPTDINALADEYLRLSYHGLRAKDKSFNATMKTDFDETIGKINIIPQDIGRVLLNLYNNAFYACTERSRSTVNQRISQNLISNAKEVTPFQKVSPLYETTVSITTKKSDNHVIITVSDNGNGIPQKIVDKIFQPFFTTKPAGQGTGLGLSLSYDIVKAHGGEIKVETKEGEGTVFTVALPSKENL